jgi:hypothetical protein
MQLRGQTVSGIHVQQLNTHKKTALLRHSLCSDCAFIGQIKMIAEHDSAVIVQRKLKAQMFHCAVFKGRPLFFVKWKAKRGEEAK